MTSSEFSPTNILAVNPILLYSLKILAWMLRILPPSSKMGKKQIGYITWIEVVLSLSELFAPVILMGHYALLENEGIVLQMLWKSTETSLYKLNGTICPEKGLLF